MMEVAARDIPYWPEPADTPCTLPDQFRPNFWKTPRTATNRDGLVRLMAEPPDRSERFGMIRSRTELHCLNHMGGWANLCLEVALKGNLISRVTEKFFFSVTPTTNDERQLKKKNPILWLCNNNNESWLKHISTENKVIYHSLAK